MGRRPAKSGRGVEMDAGELGNVDVHLLEGGAPRVEALEASSAAPPRRRRVRGDTGRG